jgi:hypothetical protein
MAPRASLDGGNLRVSRAVLTLPGEDGSLASDLGSACFMCSAARTHACVRT